MDKHDQALDFAWPRLLGGIYFGLLSVVGTILINALLVSIGIQEIIPLFQAILLGMVVASATGALFGDRIIHCPKPYKLTTFWIGFMMVMLSLPVFDLGILLFLKEDATVIFPLRSIHEAIVSYFTVVAYSYLLFGVFLAVGAGIAAMYLRGQMVYDILYTDEYRKRSEEHELARVKKATVHHKTTPHTKKASRRT